MKFYASPRIIGITHAAHVPTEGIVRAIKHARAISIDRTSALVGGTLSYDGRGFPVDVESPDAEFLEAICIDVEFAHVAPL